MRGFDRNKPFNALPDLPPPDSILDVEILTKWGLASRTLAELNRNILRIPNPTMLVNTISLQEARSSTAIENIFTTEDELYKAVSDSIKETNADPAIKEVLRYREALWGGYKAMTENGAFDLSIALQVFRQIKNTNQGIRPPQSQTVIKRGMSELKPGEIIYTPPRGAGVLEQKLENMYAFLESDTTFDPLLKMIIAHYQFEAIHPFTDGNGRTGRILNLLYLIDQQLLSHPVLYLSKYIISNKEEYYHHLSGVTQRQAWKPWILFMLAAVDVTARHTNHLIDDILSQMEATYQYASQQLKWFTLDLNQALFSQPYFKQKLIGEVTGARSRTTLTNYMKELMRYKVLSVRQEGREVFYINDDLVRILQGAG